MACLGQRIANAVKHLIRHFVVLLFLWQPFFICTSPAFIALLNVLLCAQLPEKGKKVVGKAPIAELLAETTCKILRNRGFNDAAGCLIFIAIGE